MGNSNTTEKYYGEFNYFKKEVNISINGIETPIENSLCFRFTNETDDKFTEQACHPMHPCSDDGLILPIFFEDTWSVGFRTFSI